MTENHGSGFVASSDSELIEQVTLLLEGERDLCANLANASAALFRYFNLKKNNKINWLGFYIFRFENKKAELVLGPFQGNVACIRIPLGKGVCGTAALERTTLLVKNVHDFPGHIACDSASESEIVVPIISTQFNNILGVIDIDSTVLACFDESDKILLEKIATLLSGGIDWPEAK